MSGRVARLLLLAVCLCQLAPATARAQTMAELREELSELSPEELVAIIVDPQQDYGRRVVAQNCLPRGWTPKPEQVPGIDRVLAEGDDFLSLFLAYRLGHQGTASEPFLATLVDLARRDDLSIQVIASGAVERTGILVRDEGRILWWVIPYAYRYELVALLIYLAALAVGVRKLRRGRHAGEARAPLGLLVGAAVGAILPACVGAHHALHRVWAVGYQPETLLGLPFKPLAVVLLGVGCLLLALGACRGAQRKDDAGGPERDHPIVGVA